MCEVLPNATSCPDLRLTCSGPNTIILRVSDADHERDGIPITSVTVHLSHASLLLLIPASAVHIHIRCERVIV